MDILIAVSDPAMRKNLQALLEVDEDFRVRTCGATAEEILTSIAEAAPGLLILDLLVPGLEGEKLVRAVKNASAMTEILVLADMELEDSLFAVLKAGASGYIRNDAPPFQILAAIEEIRGGGAPISTSIARKMLLEFQRHSAKEDLKEIISPLSSRETEVLELLYRGHNYRAIADILFISFSTVHSHVKNIYAKLQVNSRSEAIYEALRKKLLR